MNSSIGLWANQKIKIINLSHIMYLISKGEKTIAENMQLASLHDKYARESVWVWKKGGGVF